jgi:autotransporter-associated beta strand protein
MCQRERRIKGKSTFTLVQQWVQLTLFAAAALSVFQSNPLFAATANWDGDSAVGVPGDGVNWSNADNWDENGVADTAPSSTSPGDDLTFGGGTVGTINLGSADRYANSITFTAGFTLGTQGSTAKLNISSGDVTVDSGVSATINAMLGNDNLTLDGGGTLTLTGNNDFRSGNITVDNGILVAGYITSLGFGSEQINANGTLDLNTANSGIGSITNAGTININAVGAGVAAVTNTGNVNVNASAGFGTQTNNAAYTIAAGAAFTGFSGANFTQNAGTLTVNGSMSLTNATFYDNGGTIGGAVTLGSTNHSISTLSFGTESPSGGTFNLIGSTTSGVAAYTAEIYGNIPAGTTVNIEPSNTSTLGTLTVEVNYPMVNNGTLNLSATGQNHNIVIDGELNNTGTINIKPGPTADGGRTIEGSITNSGTLNVNATTVVEGMTNTGTINVAAGKAVSLSEDYFTQTSGTLNINGSVNISGSEFYNNGGAITGSGAVVFSSDNGNTELSFGSTPASGGTFNFVGTTTSTSTYYDAEIYGNIPSGVTVNIEPSDTSTVGTLELEVNYPTVNNGTLNLLATGQNHNIVIEGQLNNNGTININPGPTADGGRTFEGGITNSGTLNVNATTVVEGMTNTGTINIASGKTLSSGSFTQSSGTLNINGTLTTSGYSFDDNGGAITGSGAVILTCDTGFPELSFGSTPASGGTFDLVGTTTSTSIDYDAQTVGSIPAGTTVNIEPSNTSTVGTFTVDVNNAMVNNGTLNLLATGQNHNIVIEGDLNNNGTININPGPTADGGRTIEGSITNSGTLNVNASAISEEQVTNTGSINIAAGKTYTIQQATFYQNSGTIAANGNLLVTSGSMYMNGGTLGGTIEVIGGTFYNNGGTISQTVTLAGEYQGNGVTVDPNLDFGSTPASGGTFDFIGAPSASVTYCDSSLYSNTIPTGVTLNVGNRSVHFSFCCHRIQAGSGGGLMPQRNA